jgi:hypothetical protein
VCGYVPSVYFCLLSFTCPSSHAHIPRILRFTSVLHSVTNMYCCTLFLYSKTQSFKSGLNVCLLVIQLALAGCLISCHFCGLILVVKKLNDTFNAQYLKRQIMCFSFTSSVRENGNTDAFKFSNVTVFWDIAFCGLIEVHRCLKGACCLHLKCIPHVPFPRKSFVTN